MTETAAACVRSALLAVGISATAWHSVGALTVSPPPTKEYAAQTWLGFSTDDRYCIRLQLYSSGTGAGFLVPVDGVTQQFEITSWRLDGQNLRLSVHFQAAGWQA